MNLSSGGQRLPIPKKENNTRETTSSDKSGNLSIKTTVSGLYLVYLLMKSYQQTGVFQTAF